jgi:hypothetical protein
MNTIKKFSIQLTGVAMTFMLFSLTAFSRDHVTVNLKNISVTATTIEYDLYVTNDGSSNLRMSGCSFGVNIDQAALDGGSITCTYNANIRNCVLNDLHKYALNTNADTKSVQARMTTAYSAFEKSTELLPNVAVKIGRFTIRNSNNWAENGRSELNLQESALKGATACYLLCFADNNPLVTALTAEAGTLGCQAEVCPLLNPSRQSGNTTSTASLKAGNGLTVSTQQPTVYPNPVSDILHLDYVAAVNSSIGIRIYDLQGRLVYQSQAVVTEGANNVAMPLQSLVQGMYFIQITDEYNSSSKLTFMKQ